MNPKNQNEKEIEAFEEIYRKQNKKTKKIENGEKLKSFNKKYKNIENFRKTERLEFLCRKESQHNR